MQIERTAVRLADGEELDALLERPSRSGGSVSLGLVLAHGQQGDLDDDLLAELSSRVVAQGAAVLRFRFPYRQAGRTTPDPLPRLQEAFRQALALLRRQERLTSEQVIVGGRSLGARVASLMTAGGEGVGGLLLLAYPLHLPDDPATLRDTHLYVINRPMLFVSGSEDPYCRPDLLRPVLRRLGELATLELLPGADHGFGQPGEPPAARAARLAQVADRVHNWLIRQFPGIEG